MRNTDYIPSVSIIIPAYNSGTSVVNAVRSTTAQSWPKTEIIVVDDGSTDDTKKLLGPFMDQIHYVYQSNKGRSAARNRGIEMATSDYIAFLDADDIWYPTKLERQLTMLRTHPKAQWGYCRVSLVDNKGEPLASDFWPQYYGSGKPGIHDALVNLLSGGFEIHTSTVLVKRDLLAMVGSFDESLETAEDTNLWIRLAKVSPLLFQPEVLGTRQINTDITFRERMSSYEYATNGLRAVQNGLACIGLNPKVDPLAQQALARSLMNSAFIEFDKGNCDDAMEYWQESKALAQDMFLSDELSTQLVYFALGIARYHDDGPKFVESILSSLIERLPIEARKRKKIGKIARARMFAVISFMYKNNQHTSLAGYYARRALLTGISNWQNLGLWKQALYLTRF